MVDAVLSPSNDMRCHIQVFPMPGVPDEISWGEDNYTEGGETSNQSPIFRLFGGVVFYGGALYESVSIDNCY